LSPYSLIGGCINPAALMRCDLENTSHSFREGNQSLHLFMMLGIRCLLHQSPYQGLTPIVIAFGGISPMKTGKKPTGTCPVHQIR
jgi:hypothetical protein